MTPEKLFHELLGLGLKWEVIESRFERESGMVFLEIRETAQLWEAAHCPKDGGLVFCYDHTELLTWRHLNIFQHQCQITCRLPRGKCRQCGHVFRVRPPWEGLSMHFTKECEAFALLLLREMPVRAAAKLVGETDTRLWRMIFRHVEAAYAEADFSVFADLLKKRVLFATEGVEARTWVQFVEALEKHNGHAHAITQVSMDMSRAYQAGVAQTCRNAQVAFDKFHVMQNAGQAVDKVRQAEIRIGGPGVWEALTQSQWIWRKNPENLTDKQSRRLAKIKDKNLATAKAYQMRLVLQDIYRSPDVNTARDRLNVWCRWVRWVARFYKGGLFASMIKLKEMIERHLKGILAHWKWGLTNAFMEGLNSVFSATKRRARGYRSSVYLIAILYFTAGQLRLPHF
jgi:transposase